MPTGAGDMNDLSAAQLRAFILEQYPEELRAIGVSAGDVPDDFDLHAAGVIDSLGLLELIAAIEERFGLEVDFEALDPDQLTTIGPLTHFIEKQGREAPAA